MLCEEPDVWVAMSRHCYLLHMFHHLTLFNYILIKLPLNRIWTALHAPQLECTSFTTFFYFHTYFCLLGVFHLRRYRVNTNIILFHPGQNVPSSFTTAWNVNRRSENKLFCAL